MSSTSIQSRPLGNNGPVVPRLGLGLMNNSGAYNESGSDDERLAFLDKAYALGERFWDSADMYADSEDLLGKWFARNPEKRSHIFLATKFGFDVSNPEKLVINSSPDYCRSALSKSLARLGVSYVDLYYVHRVDGTTPIEKTMETLVELKNEGKLKYIGLSGVSADTLRRAYAVHPVTCIQMEYSLFYTELETKVLETARELGVAIVAYSPLGRGLLTGAITGVSDVSGATDMRSAFGFPWYREENLKKNVALVKQIGDVAAAKGASTSQVCLAWILAQGDDFFAIPGTRKAERLQENLASMDIVLTADEEKLLRKLGEQVAGASMIPEHMALSYGDTPAL
ncbi:aldo-keto reductase putative [Ophiostoma piceae UAMH 11346]|uniref:Aldo-keto reductase putative n=1 Tax=Ophiostoma piceae (strain UAMH 11346) TaxID=1262450 RepID=S3BYP5_OPHP1|nr:aldo-keto reductase putative [Ophiostoma piceae UAMH 11346]